MAGYCFEKLSLFMMLALVVARNLCIFAMY